MRLFFPCSWAADIAVLRLLAKKSCTQLDGKFLDEEQADQVAKNLAFVACAMQAASESAFDALPGGGGKRSREELEEEEEEEEGGAKEGLAKSRLTWLFRQLSYLARNSGGGYAVVRRKVHPLP